MGRSSRSFGEGSDSSVPKRRSLRGKRRIDPPCLASSEYRRRFVKSAHSFSSYGEVLSLLLLSVGAKASSLSGVVLGGRAMPGGRQAWGQSALDSAERVREQPCFLSHGLDVCEGGKREQCRDGNVLLTVKYFIRWPGEPSSRTADSNREKVATSRNE